MPVGDSSIVERIQALHLRDAEADLAFQDEARDRLKQTQAQLDSQQPESAAEDQPEQAPREELESLRAAFEARLNAAQTSAAEEIAGLQQEIDRLREQLTIRETEAARAQRPLNEDAPPQEDLGRGTLDEAGEPDAPAPEFDAFDDAGHKKRMGQILLEAGILRSEDLEDVLNEQRSHPQRRLGKLMVDHGYASEEVIARVLAAQLKLPYIDLDKERREGEARSELSGQLARHYQCFPLRIERHTLIAAMANPLDLIAIENIELATGFPLSPAVATPSAVARMIEQHYAE